MNEPSTKTTPVGEESRPSCRDIRRIDLTEFRDRGYLQEMNRRFLHPLGLALEFCCDGDGTVNHIGGIWDFRHDPEGMAFTDKELGTDVSRTRATNVNADWAELREAREKLFGNTVQPIPPRKDGGT